MQAPGALTLAGELAVNEREHYGLGVAIDRYVYCDYEDTSAFMVNLPDLNISKLNAEYHQGQFQFSGKMDEKVLQETELTRVTVETTLQFLEAIGKNIRPFAIATDTIEHNITLKSGKSQSVGLGTSAALATCIIGVLLKAYDFDLTKKETQQQIYKLAVVSHYRGNVALRSGLDIACSIWGQVVHYRRFDSNWLWDQLDGNVPLDQLIHEPWPNVDQERIAMPDDIFLTAAWCQDRQHPAEVWEKLGSLQQNNPQIYQQFVTMAAQTADKMTMALRDNHQTYLTNLVDASELLLERINTALGLSIITDDLNTCLKIIKKHEGVGKMTGLFHGDCVLGLCFDQYVKEDIEWDWEEQGFYPLDVFVTDKGVSVWY